MTLRKATAEDAERVWQIITEAKRAMAAEGRNQWTEEYPSRCLIEADIRSGCAYVMCGDGGEADAYALITAAEEPAYAGIRGRWLTPGPYCTVHRLAVAADRRGRGLGKTMMLMAETVAAAAGARSIRVDTNHDNAEMLSLLPAIGYERCGTVSYGPRGERMAFEKELPRRGRGDWARRKQETQKKQHDLRT